MCEASSDDVVATLRSVLRLSYHMHNADTETLLKNLKFNSSFA